MNQVFTDYFRCADGLAEFALIGKLADDLGYFQFGEGTVCYGRSSFGSPSPVPDRQLYDAFEDVRIDGGTIHLPFDPTEIINNLRCERYAEPVVGGLQKRTVETLLRNIYYSLRPVLPVSVRKYVQRMYFSGWDQIPFPNWPVDRTVDQILRKLLGLALRAQGMEKLPFIWFWPQGFPSCAMITHDVETISGRDYCSSLMEIDTSFGIRSSFQVIPEERYPVSQGFRESILDRGFELNVHDLNHDGQLFKNRKEFERRARLINRYVKEYRADGFRAGVMYRNVDWLDELDISYDMSVPNTAHLDPQRGGCCTIMPYFVGHVLELPLTTSQDYTLFHILGDYSIDLWKEQIDIIIANHGLVSFDIHPDYIIEKRAQRAYIELLKYLSRLRSERKLWIASPGEINSWWRQRSQMKLFRDGHDYRIQGENEKQGRVGYVNPHNGQLECCLEPRR